MESSRVNADAGRDAATEKTASRLARKIARDVAERGLPPGSVLSSEHAMAQELGAGRATMREALRLLESQGLVVMRRGTGGGPVVGHPDGTHLGRTITLFLQMHQTRFGEALNTWVMLESAIAADAARNFSLVSAALRQRVTRFVAVAESNGTAWADEAAVPFHRMIWELTDNSMLRLLVEAVAAIVVDRTHFDQCEPTKPSGSPEPAEFHREHRAIASAIVAGDAHAAHTRMEAHGAQVSHMLRRRYPGLADQVVDWR